MKKIVLLLSIIMLLVTNCSTSQSINSKRSTPNVFEFAKTITAENLKTMLYTYASDEFEGRKTGEPGQK